MAPASDVRSDGIDSPIAKTMKINPRVIQAPVSLVYIKKKERAAANKSTALYGHPFGFSKMFELQFESNTVLEGIVLW
ncbi:hypothetical protein [Natrarchaeobaculum aegyptiacum]|uniref:hypothetical protein n=1 Tax=Natrarchaeobaculum aegyptiacum TaxID=745377 RepID=UPI00137471C4|nr:hypothetical protein [Natrarchaeobaculum aegyptiacum]